MTEEQQNDGIESNNDRGQKSDELFAVKDTDKGSSLTVDSGMELPPKKKRNMKGTKSETDESQNHSESVETIENNSLGNCNKYKEISLTIQKKRESYKIGVVVGHQSDNTLSRKAGFGLRDSSKKNYEEELESDENDEVGEKVAKAFKRGNPRRKRNLKRAKGKKGVLKTELSKEEPSNFEVEKIIDMKHLKNGKRNFLIRWKGFSPESDTWEPEDNLDCKDLVEEYFKKNKKEDRGENDDDEDEVKLSRLRKTEKETGGRRRSGRITGSKNNEEGQDSDASAKRSRERSSRSSSRLSRGNSSVVTLEEILPKSRKYQDGNKRKKAEESESGETNKRNKKVQDMENVAKTTVSTEESDDSGMGDAEEFEVQKIVDVRHLRDGSREFFIKWKGFSSKHNSWEPEKHLNCSDKLKEFLEEMEKNGDKPMRELRFHRKKTDRLILESPRTRKLSTRIQRQPRKSYIEDE